MGGRSQKEETENQQQQQQQQLKRKRKRPNTNLTVINSNKHKNHKKNKKKDEEASSLSLEISDSNSASPSASEQLRFFFDEFQSAKGFHLSSLEFQSLKDSCILELPHASHFDVKMLGESIKAAFGGLWKQVLCEGQLVEGKIDAGNPAVLVIASSALRSIDLLRGFRSLTKECRPGKLFSKHMKVEEQVSFLKNRVNIACGTPSRIKKLIDIEALGLSRLQILLLDMHPDIKGYSLFTLPQVRDEFWDMFKNYFYQPMIQGDLRICLYGPYQMAVRLKGKQTHPIPDK